MLIVPVRVIVGFSETRKLTALFPLEASLLILIQRALLFTEKSQFCGAVILTVKYPPLVGTVNELFASAKVQTV